MRVGSNVNSPPQGVRGRVARLSTSQETSPPPLGRGRGIGPKKQNAKRHPSPWGGAGGEVPKTERKTSPLSRGEGPGVRPRNRTQNVTPLPRRGAGGEGARRSTSQKTSPLPPGRGRGRGPKNRTQNVTPLPWGGAGGEVPRSKRKPYPYSNTFHPFPLKPLPPSPPYTTETPACARVLQRGYGPLAPHCQHPG